MPRIARGRAGSEWESLPAASDSRPGSSSSPHWRFCPSQGELLQANQAICPSFAPVKHPHVCWFCCQNHFQPQHGGFAASPWLPAPSPCLRGPTGPCLSQADLGEDKKRWQHFHRQNRRGEAEGQRRADTRKVRRARWGFCPSKGRFTTETNPSKPKKAFGFGSLRVVI